jgi:hypothetical protein
MALLTAMDACCGGHPTRDASMPGSAAQGATHLDRPIDPVPVQHNGAVADFVFSHGDDVQTTALGPVHCIADKEANVHAEGVHMDTSGDGFSTPKRNPILPPSVSYFDLV